MAELRENSGMGWWHFDQRPNKVRTAIRRKYGYPPDLEDAAIRTVALQAEALAAEMKAAMCWEWYGCHLRDWRADF